MIADVEGVLFDMDGTLVDSGPVVEECWAAWASEYAIADERLASVLGHGIPARQIVEQLVPSGEVADAVARIEQLEIDRASGLMVLPGAEEVLASVPQDRWAIVTSCTRPLAEARLKAVGMHPPALVTADDVQRGKPDPAPFVRGAAMLGVDPRRCAVFEDAPAGIAAGNAAGAATVAVATTSDAAELRAVADMVVPDLSWLSVREEAGGQLRVAACG
ncbi:HAD-IA family hydrolase [Haloactinospora alba]|uniref:HAD-IA family hydrolase n=1 Tax=Haloactinospora alba TaxID=405555 RepID=UPI001FE3BAF9|nr:HAD-IA family hydrolase [Haloactinospora alba]